MKESEFVFDSVDLLCYELHKIILNRGEPYVDSSKWLKNKNSTINSKNSNDKCSQYALPVALNYQNIKNNLERISIIKPFIDQYNWKEISFPSHQKDWKDFELNNKLIAPNILSVPYNTEEIRHAYKLKHIKRENQVILLTITDGKKWQYLAVKKLSALLRGITSNHKGDFYCLNSLHSYRTKNKFKKHENVFKNHGYCYVEMLEEYNKILKYNHGEKSMKVPFVICADLES